MTDPTGPARPTPGALDERDFELVRAVQRGELDAFERFVTRFGPLVMAFGLRMCGNRPDAEDVFQETLIKVFTSLSGLQEPAALRTWFWRVVANECLMSRRGPRNPARTLGLEDLFPRSVESGTVPELPDDASPSPERELLRGELRERIEAAIRNLPPDYRIVLLLRDFEELSTDEVADVLRITPGNVKVRLHRARQALRRLLEAGATGGR
jgi:RNA polymerase sigma-70 factor (ECF subfamily)